MMHVSTPLSQPRPETLSMIRLFARLYEPQGVGCLGAKAGLRAAAASEDGWFDKHPLSGKAV